MIAQGIYHTRTWPTELTEMKKKKKTQAARYFAFSVVMDNIIIMCVSSNSIIVHWSSLRIVCNTSIIVFRVCFYFLLILYVLLAMYEYTGTLFVYIAYTVRCSCFDLYFIIINILDRKNTLIICVWIISKKEITIKVDAHTWAYTYVHNNS